MTDDANKLFINGDVTTEQTRVNLEQGEWQKSGATETLDSTTYDIYTADDGMGNTLATLLIEQNDVDVIES